MALYDDDDDSNNGLLTEERSVWKDEEVQHQLRYTRAVIIPWILALFFFCTTCLFAWQSRATPIFEVSDKASYNGTYETGYSTDFGAYSYSESVKLRVAKTCIVSESPGIDIQIIQKHFTNDLRFNTTSQQIYNELLDPNEVKYIGPPSDEIDAAWHALLRDQYVSLTPDETLQFPEQDRALIFWDHAEHYYFELSVFHNLHCLNEIRMMVDHEYYKAKSPHMPGDLFAAREHIDHCIDQIRQALQCHADLTPVPMLPIQGSGAFIGNGEVHTCRDFDRVREWVGERARRAKPLGVS